jgi:hypothetical protein
MTTRMHRSALVLCTLAAFGCVTEARQTRPPEAPPPVAEEPPAAAQAPPRAAEVAPPPVPDRSRQVLDEIQRQQRWTRDALAGKPPPDELRDVRNGDAEAVADARKRFRRLVTAIERTTWIRENVPGVLPGASDPDRLIAAFDQAARDRNGVFAAADSTARALAESRSRNAISLDELRRAVQESHRARQSEQRLAAKLGRAPASQPNAPPDPLQRLRTVPMPPEPPFVAATAKYLSAHPAEERALDSWPSQLAQERTQVRAAIGQLRAEGADAGTSDLGGPAEDEETLPLEGEADAGTDAGVPASSAAEEGAAAADAGAPSPADAGAVQVSGDLKRLLARRGPPLRIEQRPDGLSAFRYTEQRPCGVDQCTVTVDYLFNSSGRLVRSEVVKQ